MTHPLIGKWPCAGLFLLGLSACDVLGPNAAVVIRTAGEAVATANRFCGHGIKWNYRLDGDTWFLWGGTDGTLQIAIRASDGQTTGCQLTIKSYH